MHAQHVGAVIIITLTRVFFFLWGHSSWAMHKVITQPPGGPGKGQRAGQGTGFITQKAPKNSWTHLEQAFRPQTLYSSVAGC